MKALNIYEIGVDALPVEHMEIGLIKSSDQSFGFVGLTETFGTVELNYDDLKEKQYESLNEALKDGCSFNLKGDGAGICDESGEDIDLLIRLAGTGLDPLCNGDKWFYMHDLFGIVDNTYPFQTYESHMQARNHSWLVFVDRKIIEPVDAFDKGLFTIEDTVCFNDKEIKVVFRTESLDDMSEAYMSSFEILN